MAQYLLVAGADTPSVKQSYWLASFNVISVNGIPVVGSTAAIFDTGTTEIVGDPAGIAALFGAIPGAQLAPQLGNNIYTSTFSGATDQSTGVHIPSIPQSLARSILPSLLT
jgi:hypothetical protein